nr:hypothetical protein [Tanacetum cinerariifolium]
MDAPTLSVSAEKNPGDPFDIRVDIVHPTPADVFPAATMVRRLAQHGEAIRGIHGHLEGVPINEEINALRFIIGMVKEQNASLRGSIKTMEAIDTITRRQDKRARTELKRQLTLVQESQRQDQENFRKLQEFVTSQLGRHSQMHCFRIYGTEGVVSLSQWVEKMESFFHISGCVVENQEIFKKKLTDKYCPKGEIKKLEIELWNLKVKGNDVG